MLEFVYDLINEQVCYWTLIPENGIIATSCNFVTK